MQAETGRDPWTQFTKCLLNVCNCPCVRAYMFVYVSKQVCRSVRVSKSACACMCLSGCPHLSVSEHTCPAALNGAFSGPFHVASSLISSLVLNVADAKASLALTIAGGLQPHPEVPPGKLSGDCFRQD